MLDIGQSFAGCRIIEALAETPAYSSYLVACEESEQAKILLFGEDRSTSASRRQLQKQAEQLAAQEFVSCGTPLRVGDQDGQFYCLFPLPSGEPLAERLASPFSVRQALTLLHQLAETLNAPHSEGLSYGQLSPATIFTEEEHVFLADFGLPLLVKLDYNSGLDPRYLSPEQVRGEDPQPAADIYSLGILAQRLLTGTCALDGDDPFDIATRHLEGELPALPGALSICQPLLDTMTCLSPAERLTSQQLATELQTLLAGDEIDHLEWPPVAPEPTDPTEQDSGSEQIGGEEKSDVASRIEERLKTSPPDFSTLNAAEKAAPAEETVEADHPVVRAASPVGRYLLILLLGIALGSGAYFYLYPLSAPSQSEVALPATSPEPAADPLTAPLNRAVELWLAGDSAAEAEFQRLSREYAEDPRIYNNLAVIAAAQGHYEQARNYLEQALTTDQNFATIYRNLGSVYAAMARDSYGRALHLNESQSALTLQPLSSRGPVALTAQNSGQDGGPGSQQAAAAEPVARPTQAEEPRVASSGPQDQKEQDSPSEAVTADPSIALQPSVTDQQAVTAAVSAEEAAPAVEQQEAAVASVSEASPPGQRAAGTESLSAAEEFLKSWARDWSNQDVAAYLDHYGAAFDPPGEQSLDAWRAERRRRVSRPDQIEVELDQIEINDLADGRFQADLIQSYRSDNYADRVRKIIDLVSNDEGWRIVRERSLGRAP